MITDKELLEDAREQVAFHQRILDECRRGNIPDDCALENLAEWKEILHVRKVDMSLGL